MGEKLRRVVQATTCGGIVFFAYVKFPGEPIGREFLAALARRTEFNRDLKLLAVSYRILRAKKSMTVLTSSLQRCRAREGWDKVTGAARYVEDMRLPGMLYWRYGAQQCRARQNQKISFYSNVDLDDFVV